MSVDNSSGGFFGKSKHRRACSCSLVHQLLSKSGMISVGFDAACGGKDG